MKFCIVVCVFLMVAYSEASALKTLTSVKGNCTQEDLKDMLGECVDLLCHKHNDGKIHIVKYTCPPFICKDTPLLEVTEDLDKPYPDCCPKARCA